MLPRVDIWAWARARSPALLLAAALLLALPALWSVGGVMEACDPPDCERSGEADEEAAGRPLAPRAALPPGCCCRTSASSTGIDCKLLLLTAAVYIAADWDDPEILILVWLRLIHQQCGAARLVAGCGGGGGRRRP